MKPIRFIEGNRRTVVTIYTFSRQINCSSDRDIAGPQCHTELWQQLLEISNWRFWLPHTVAVSSPANESFGRGSIICVEHSQGADNWQVTYYDAGARMVLQNATTGCRRAWSIATTRASDDTIILSLDIEFEISGFRRFFAPVYRWQCARWSRQFQANLQNWLEKSAP